MRSSKLSLALSREALAVRKQATQGRLRGTPSGRTILRMLESLVDIELADRAMTLAAKAFTSVLPVIIAASSIRRRNPLAFVIHDQLGIDPETLTGMGGGRFAVTEPSYAAFGIVGVLMLLISGTSYARALGRLYSRVWSVPVLGVTHGAWRWLAVLLATAASAALLGWARGLSGIAIVGSPLALVAECCIWFALWTVTPYLLTAGRLSGRLLWATGGITAVGLTALRVAGRVTLPRTAASAERKFGALGLVFTSIGWLFLVLGVVVVAATITKALALDEGRLGRLLRGPVPPESSPT